MHPAGVLVAQDVGQRRVHRRVPLALHDVQVGAAHPGAADLHDDVERAAEGRLGYLIDDGHLVKSVQTDGLHCSSSPSPDVPYRCRSMPRQMPAFASMLTRVVCARRRCSGTASAASGAPVAGSISSGASSPAGSPSSARRCRSRSSAGGRRRLAQGERGQLRRPGARRGQRAADEVGAGHHRLTQEVGAQLVQLADRLAVEGPGEPGPGCHPAVDRIRGEVVFEHHLRRAHAGQGRHRVVGVGHHQEGEVGRAEIRREPQPDLGVPVRGDGARRDEAERGDRLVQLRVPHRLERGQYPRGPRG